MTSHYLVRLAKGPEWDAATSRREQAGWGAHAAFMDGLAEEGFVLLGGPVGEGDGEDALLVIAADNETEIRARLTADPWADTILTISSIEPWAIWLRSCPHDDPRKGV